MGAAREHGILDALHEARVRVIADTGHQGAGPTFEVPPRRRRRDPDIGRYRRLSRNQKDVNAAHARQRGPGERVNAVLTTWKILRNIRSYPTHATRPGQRCPAPHPRWLSQVEKAHLVVGKWRNG
jgi:hypothetical protein